MRKRMTIQSFHWLEKINTIHLLRIRRAFHCCCWMIQIQFRRDVRNIFSQTKYALSNGRIQFFRVPKAETLFISPQKTENKKTIFFACKYSRCFACHREFSSQGKHYISFLRSCIVAALCAGRRALRASFWMENVASCFRVLECIVCSQFPKAVP